MLLDVFRILNDEQPGMPVTTAQVFLLIAARPGIGVSKVAEELGIRINLASMVVGRLKSGGPEESGVSLGLVQVDATRASGRNKPLRLTSKGQRLYAKILSAAVDVQN